MTPGERTGQRGGGGDRDGQMAARGRWTLRPRPPEEGQSTRRRSLSAGISVALHVVLGAVLLRVLTIPLPLHTLFSRDDSPERVTERITYVAVPGAEVPTEGRSGGDGRRERPGAESAPPLVAPTEVPTRVPPPPPTPAPERPVEGGTGPVIGEGGAARGVRPALSDPRIWTPPSDVADGARTLPREKNPAEKLDSVVASTLRAHADSMRIHAPPPTKFERGDWTVERNGQKWGIDQQFIRLGKVSIPTALLALLPLNKGQANPIAYERERALAAMRQDILEHANAQINEAEFRKTVRAIRERKDRERREAEKQKVAEKPIVMPPDGPPRP